MPRCFDGGEDSVTGAGTAEVETFTTLIEAIEARLKKIGKLPAADAARRILQPKKIETDVTRRRGAAAVAKGAR